MYRTSIVGGNPFAALFLGVTLILGVAGCGGGGPGDRRPNFQQASIPDKTYVQRQVIIGETLPAAVGGDGALTYTVSPALPAGLIFDPASRLLSGTPSASQPATLYSYTTTDSDAADPDSASLTFRITVEPVALVTISAEVEEVDEGDDLTPIDITLTLSEAVKGQVAVVLASTGTADAGSDFDIANTEIIVTEGRTQATTTVTPIRDLESEQDETITLEIDSVDGRGEVGAPSSARVAIRDLGTPPPNEYAVLDANLRVWGGTSYDIGTDTLYLSYNVWNSGLVAASPTRAVLLTTTDLFSEDTSFRSLAARPVPALEPGGLRFSDTIRVPFDKLARGSNNYFALVVLAVAEEDPDLVDKNEGGAVDYSAVFLSNRNRIPTACTGFERGTEPGTPDPLFGEQWALRNTGQTSFAEEGGIAGEDLNMELTLVDGPTGAGVQVAVADTGLETCHPDLAANIEPGLSYNFNAPFWYGARANDPFLPTVLGDHGTSVAGLIAASANNGVGGRGVAPEARLRGFNFLSFPQSSSYFDALGMSSESPQSDDVHIFNMSFGSSGGASNLTADERELFRVGVTDIRNGLGALYVKAAGNQFDDCTKLDDEGQPVAPRLDLSAELGCFAANRDGENNVPQVIVVGGFSADGKRSSYSMSGATLWVVAPAGEFGRDRPAMITTDQMGSDRGYVLIPRGLTAGDDANALGDYTSIFNGTSAAAPNASGAIALLLEAQPELTWRDVKHILATTARRLDADIPRVRVAFGGTPAVLRHGWITNAAGYSFHNWYGFGAINVDAAVALAATHAPDSLGVFTESAPIRLAGATTIPDHDGGGLTQTQNVTGLSRTANIEALQLRIEVTHTSPRELGIELTSPAGTRSIINPVFNHALNGIDNPLDWTILSNAFYGEPPTGQWTLKVIDAAEGNTGTLDAWSLIFYLGEHPEDD
ncbi:MAG: S8 family serine peptidase [Candidatus Tectomicrobia bacterium]|nr:S8 family serine peptidase [Candidatus Tectomicrobia bacterium]